MKLILLLMVLAASGCALKVSYVDQQKAAVVAGKFSDTAFVKRDFKAALEWVNSDQPPNVAESMLEDIVTSMHPAKTYPVRVIASEYEVIPNSPHVNIFLEGEGSKNEKYYYKLVMVAAGRGDYKVRDLWRNKKDEPFEVTNGLIRKKL